MSSCPYCKAKLPTSPNGISISCFNPECQRKAIIANQSKEKSTLGGIKQEIETFTIDAMAADSGSSDSTMVDENAVKIFQVPANTNSLVPASDKRRTLFIEYLQTIYDAIINDEHFDDFPYSQLFSRQSSEPHSEPHSEKGSGQSSAKNSTQGLNEDDEALNLGCATCKGFCCLLGEDHAFMDKTSLLQHFSTIGDMPSFSELTDFYLQHFPNESTAFGCIFQGATGCTLPKERRSITCNQYTCKELESIAKIKNKVLEGPVGIGAVNGKKLVRVKAIPNDGSPNIDVSVKS